ncbi:hypothetical protein AJ85_00245 [Alkalihalobacillus alcalophilus ATCC 27647 = CGMCC 1.3604]|uniref:Uncharacterized protein n=2 Tax=Alkalihalobacillus alcalophilus TaxID=1445 RepID=A0A4S4JWT7_ALKAL|nr:hypothetical protein AJ85_00245 [Alkalihalobacillus alcalophilus ATCC 27647 = CGMCC 1.3604]
MFNIKMMIYQSVKRERELQKRICELEKENTTLRNTICYLIKGAENKLCEHQNCLKVIS